MPPKKKSRVTLRNESGSNSALGTNETLARTPSPPTSNPDGTPAPPTELPPSDTPPAPNEASMSGKSTSSGVKPENWTNLKRLMDTLKRAVGVNELGHVKSIIEGLVELIGLYEDAAQGQKEFDDLRLQLECVFDELTQHLSSSPVITTSMDNICWSIQKEIEIVKARLARPKKRKSDETDEDTCVVLECYRRIQCHLQRLTRNANIKTWQIIDQLATDNRLEKLAPSLWECYNSGKAADLKRGPCTKGTRMNVLAHMHLWAAGDNNGNIYWMSGMAGTGKTTIAYSLCEQLDAEASRLLCASFFCSRSLPECRDVGRIIPSIAFQLAQFSRPFRYALSQATEKDPVAHTRLPQMQFDSLIAQPFANVNVREAFPANMVVVIDALDECDDAKSTKLILDVLLTRSKNLPIKFVVSSRPEPAIRDQMEKNGTWVDARVVLHELDSGEVKMDIKTYLKGELAPVQPLESDIDRLAERAGVLFIYAATVVRYIGYDDFARGRTRLKTVLAVSEQQSKAQTEEIDQLYATILEAAIGDGNLEPTEREDIKLILDTVICARESLTVATLNQFLQIDDVDRVQAAIRPLWSVLYVTAPDMTVTTLHASFPDYLLDPNRSGAWHCDAATHHQLLARLCFDCIRIAKPQFNICQLESSYLLDKEVVDLDERVHKSISTELRYSCQYWSSHLNAAESGTASDLMLPLSQLLFTHLLLWIEVRNLMKSALKTVHELLAAKRWAIRHGMPCEVIDLLSDAWRFASTLVSSPVLQSTPHIYVSMLPLLSPSSPIFKHYCSRFRGLIGVEGTALERRNNALLAQWKFQLYTRCIACSPDGTLVAIGGSSSRYSGHIRLYILDSFSGTLLHDLSQRGSKGNVQSISFSPGSTRLASGRTDGVISVWDVTTGQQVLSPPLAHNNCVRSILYSHDGSYIISASEDKIIHIWDAFSGNPALPPFLGHTNAVTCLTITSDDARLASGSRDGTIRVWDMKGGKTIYILDLIAAHEGSVSAIALSSDDCYIVSGTSRGMICVWDSRTGQMVLGPLWDGCVVSLSISPDGATIASTSNIDGMRVWDANSGEILSQLGPFSDDTSFGNQATYSPDGTRIIFARQDETIWLLDAQTTGTAINFISGHTSYITSIDVSPNGRHIVSGSTDCTLCVWDVAQGKLLVDPLQGHTGKINMVRFSPDGSRIVSCAKDSTVRQWDVQLGGVFGIPMGVVSARYDEIISATYSRAGAHIVSLTASRGLTVWNSSHGQLILGPLIVPGGQPYGIHAEFSPDGATVIAGYQGGLICVWDVQNGQMIYSHQGQRECTLSIAFSPNGWCYARYSLMKKLGLKNIHTGAQIPGAFEGHPGWVRSMRFSLDGTRLVSGDDAKTVHVWDVETGRSLFGPLNGHTDRVTSVGFSPDGNFVVSASWDSAIRIWDVEPKTSSGQDRDVNYADWLLNRDGWVVSGSSQRLFWVPTNLRTSLLSPGNTTLISREGYVRLKFDNALIGEAWAGCFRGC